MHTEGAQEKNGQRRMCREGDRGAADACCVAGVGERVSGTARTTAQRLPQKHKLERAKGACWHATCARDIDAFPRRQGHLEFSASR